MPAAEPTRELAPGLQVAERYRLERLLGEGGMGAVWAATHLVTRKTVALKFLKAAPENDSARRRFLREARAASAVMHPNVVEIHDIVEHQQVPVMVMDLLTGESLASKLARERSVPLGELASIMVPVISAVGTAHAAGVVHRDIKPDNVFLCTNADGTIEPKVLDFGIAKLNAHEGEAAATANLTRTGALLGTPYYMSPEQVFGEKDLDQRADVWAFGVMLYECLTGKKPVDGENMGQLFKVIVTGNVVPLEQAAPYLPSDVARAISRMLIADRAQRAPDLREIYETLKRYASVKAASFGSAVSPVPTQPTPQPNELLDELSSSGPPHAASTDGVARAVEPTITLPIEPRRVGWIMAAALVVVVGIGLLVTRSLQSSSESPAASAAASLDLPAPESSPTVSAETPSLGAPTAEADAAGAAPLPSPISRVKKLGASPSPDAGVSTTLPSAPPPTPSRQPGQVVEESPF